MSKKNKHVRYKKEQPSPAKKTWFYVNIGLAMLLIIAGVVALFWMGQQTVSSQANNTPADAVSQSQGQAAPDFTLTSLNGEPISLSDYAGQVILVNLWATWCPPCKAEMPGINALYEDYKADGFVVLAVNSQEDAVIVQQFIAEQGFTFPVVLDSRGEVMNQYQVRGLPTTFIIGRDGQIQHTQSGAISYEQLEKIIQPLL
jgi:cytochrome c biogenesis protein CcmG/thiol:disulfide interchange protein DsbE